MTKTTALVATIPNCDIHKYIDGIENVPAVYDAKTNDGRWASVCEDHFQSHTSGELGTGKGQRYITEAPAEEDKGAAIQAAMKRGDLSAIEDIVGDGDIAEYL
jgi:hypothetical protein